MRVNLFIAYLHYWKLRSLLTFDIKDILLSRICEKHSYKIVDLHGDALIPELFKLTVLIILYFCS